MKKFLNKTGLLKQRTASVQKFDSIVKGADVEERGVQSTPPLTQKFYFHGEIWTNLINFGRHIYPKYSHPLHCRLICFFKFILLPVNL